MIIQSKTHYHWTQIVVRSSSIILLVCARNTISLSFIGFLSKLNMFWLTFHCGIVYYTNISYSLYFNNKLYAIGPAILSLVDLSNFGKYGLQNPFVNSSLYLITSKVNHNHKRNCAYRSNPLQMYLHTECCIECFVISVYSKLALLEG